MYLFANERYALILDRIQSNGSVTAYELAEQLGTSTETVRRDLLYLEKQNRLQRVHGGAVALNMMKTFSGMPQRLQENKQQKEQIAQIAAKLVKEGDVLAIDAGSTAYEFVRVLKERFRNLTIITHSGQNYDVLKTVEGFRIILVGGEYLRTEDFFYGHMTLDTIQKLHVSTYFLFPSAISLKYGIADFIAEGIPIQKAYLGIADRVVVMADSSKYEKTALLKVSDMNSTYIYITSSDLDESICRLYQNNGVTLYKNEKDLTPA